ncbi:class I SAM-dependent methyltransferase [Bacillus timonensis]|uniref:Class I SAM-dependent methyltransferase n=1 Tax=Bacillus timonensis TaxID=1033734 RepID=A0A4V3V8F4_9BACI|nr:class I SAM-dependent methyltransferase [Bacillus timonensis]THE14763.1 class I SAM-dependent methyltransferase [Bacillus timonensis]
MAQISAVEKLFTVIDNTATILKEELACTYLEAVAETGENLFQNTILQEELSELSKKRIEKEYTHVKLDQYAVEEIRKSYQLAALKGMKEATQANHEMTPDAISIFMGYLVSKFTEGWKGFSIFDPAVGTANLLTTVLNQNQSKEIDAFGIDVDDLLIKVAYVSANLQRHSIQFYNQDSLQPLYIDPMDVVVSDLPVGYYPNDLGAASFELHAKKGHSYAHHLFIEQSLKYTKEGGYLFFLVPNHLFTSEYAKELNSFLKEHAYIQGMIQLPLTLFKNEKYAKSIFMIQKKGPNVKAPKQALLANLPKLSNQTAMAGIIKQIDDWFKQEKY